MSPSEGGGAAGMSDTLKIAIAVGSALLVGIIVGYALGASGKGDLEELAKQATQRLKTNETALKDARQEAELKVKQLNKSRLLLRTKEQLLRSLVELYASNYGLASQHLSNARTRLKSAGELMKKKRRDEIAKMLKRIIDTQQLVMRLDPMARRYVTELIGDVQRLPGAR